MDGEHRGAAVLRWLRSVDLRTPFTRLAVVARVMRSRPLLSASVAALVVITSGAIVFASGVFDVRKVSVVGASRATSARITAMTHNVVGDSMMTLNTSSVRHRVAALPQVASVQVTRSWPDTLRVTVVERQPVVAVHQAQGWLLVDRTATPYLTASRLPAHVLPLTIDQPSTSNPTLHAAIDVVAALPAAVRSTVIGVVAPSTAGIRLQLHGGATVVWGGPEDSTRKARALAVLLHRPNALSQAQGKAKGTSRPRVYDVSTPGFVTTS